MEERQLSSDGILKYIRHDGEASKYEVKGESFIVPRSYMAYRDENNIHRNSWGTGEYKLDIILKETCRNTKSFEQNWKADWNKRKAMQKKSSESITDKLWKEIRSQKWDAISQKWVVTILKAPADMVAKDINNAIGGEQVNPAAAKSGYPTGATSAAPKK